MSILLKKFFGIILGMVGLLPFVHAEESDIALATMLRDHAYDVVILATMLLLALVIYSIYKKPRKEKIKKFLFWSIVTVALASTFYLAGSTVYLNHVSPTGGPVHWHADFEIWNCGTKLDLVDPTGIDNRVGTWEVHEHNDDRIHIEGTITSYEQATFHHFFEIVGGTLGEDVFTYPAVAGNVTIPVVGTCNGQPAELQAFLLRTDNPLEEKQWTYSQSKIPYPWNTIMAPYSNVPPGDCLIIEFDAVKEKTTHSCASLRAAMNRGELNGR